MVSPLPQGIDVQRRSKPKGTLFIENSAEMNDLVAYWLRGGANGRITARRGDASRSAFASENMKQTYLKLEFIRINQLHCFD